MSKLSSLVLFYLTTLAVCVPLELMAQGRFQGSQPTPVQSLMPEEVEPFLARLKQNRLEGDYAFEFSLRYLPRRGKSVDYMGMLWASWNAEGSLTRIKLWPEDESVEPVDILLQNGDEPKAWLADSGGAVKLLSKEDLQEPLLEGVNYTPFDILMPFLHWGNVVYKGSRCVKSRPAHIFLMRPEDASEGKSVRMVIDSSYNALIRADVLGGKGEVERSFRIIDFKKVQDRWIVKTIDLVDEATRNKTRFEVTAAALHIVLDPEYLTPEVLGEETPIVDIKAFTFLR